MSKENPKTVMIESEELYQLLKRVNTANPKREDVVLLKQRLRGSHALCKEVLDLTQLTETQLIQSLAGDSVLIEEAIREDLAHRRHALGYDKAHDLEQLLIEQVILTWLHYYRVQYSYRQVTSKSILITQADMWERRLNAAQRRHLRAVETLARVRKLSGRGPVQINIAEQQVIVAG